MTNSPLLPLDMKCVDDPKLYDSFLFTELLRSLNLAHIHCLSSESTSVILTSLKEITRAVTWGYPVRIVPVHWGANLILWGSTELAVNLQNISKTCKILVRHCLATWWYTGQTFRFSTHWNHGDWVASRTIVLVLLSRRSRVRPSRLHTGQNVKMLL